VWDNGYFSIDNSRHTFLAIIGLGWNTFFEGVWKGANKVGIASILENATQSATEMAKNASRNLIGSSLGLHPHH
jgi:hypothetical protein